MLRPDLADESYVVPVIDAVPVGRTPGRRQPLRLVVAKRPGSRAGLSGQFPYVHCHGRLTPPVRSSVDIDASVNASVATRLNGTGWSADFAFTGLELMSPGLVAVSEWRPETEEGLRPLPSEVAYGAAGGEPARPLTLEDGCAAHQVSGPRSRGSRRSD